MHLAVNAVGLDRPGIVAALSRVLFDHDGNIEDSRMTRLGGHFAVMLVVSIPDGGDRGALQNALEAEVQTLGLTLSIGILAEDSGDDEAAGHVLTVYGADRPGIVKEVTAALAQSGANITDLATRVIEGDVYVMVMEIALPTGVDPASVEAAVRNAAQGVDVSFHPLENDTL